MSLNEEPRSHAVSQHYDKLFKPSGQIPVNLVSTPQNLAPQKPNFPYCGFLRLGAVDLDFF